MESKESASRFRDIWHYWGFDALKSYLFSFSQSKMFDQSKLIEKVINGLHAAMDCILT
jgi:hypothetical protein